MRSRAWMTTASCALTCIVVRATLRTNFYQRAADGEPKNYLSFKFDPAMVPDLPLPRPKFEIFVYSPRVEGVHLRMGYVARGGIRWSDRREDFRTEVLGLMKAQNVKNTVIVPVGAKGGFVPRRLPAGTREEVQAEVIACYQTFIRGLLDLTDNIVSGRIVPPPQVVRRDGDDAYLVVAADKGTATFSDIANAHLGRVRLLARAMRSPPAAPPATTTRRWASPRAAPGSASSATSASWASIHRTTDFTVAGIGDMSGDVFGNGMLLSRHIRLLAAFDHRHIFLDPAPDTAVSFAERARLFALPRSSWDDYDRSRISRGGGVFPRTAKVDRAVARGARAARPRRRQRPAQRGHPRDPAHAGRPAVERRHRHLREGERRDATRRSATAPTTRCASTAASCAPGWSGEGGNLGLTQRGRVEYALRRRPPQHRLHRQLRRREHLGPRGQHQDPAQPAGRRGPADPRRAQPAAGQHDGARSRPWCCATTTCRARRSARSRCSRRARLPEFQHLIRSLERSGDLNRALEFLPSDDELAERRKQRHWAHAARSSRCCSPTARSGSTTTCWPPTCRRIRICPPSSSATSLPRSRSVSRAPSRATACAARSSPPRPPTAS